MLLSIVFRRRGNLVGAVHPREYGDLAGMTDTHWSGEVLAAVIYAGY